MGQPSDPKTPPPVPARYAGYIAVRLVAHADHPVMRPADCRRRPSAQRPDRRAGARLSRALRVVGCITVPGYGPADGRAGLYVLCIVATGVNVRFCRIQRVQAGRSLAHLADPAPREMADPSGRRTVSPFVSSESRWLCVLGAKGTGLAGVLDEPGPTAPADRGHGQSPHRWAASRPRHSWPAPTATPAVAAHRPRAGGPGPPGTDRQPAAQASARAPLAPAARAAVAAGQDVQPG